MGENIGRFLYLCKKLPSGRDWSENPANIDFVKTHSVNAFVVSKLINTDRLVFRIIAFLILDTYIIIHTVTLIFTII